MSSLLKEYSKGSEAYFAERETKIGERITEAKAKIEEIENRVRAEISAIQEQRDKLRVHLDGFIEARNQIVERREATIRLISELNGVISICDEELPALDGMLDELEGASQTEDRRLEDAEKSRHRQLSKHERARTRFELRQTRLQLRKRLFFGENAKNGGNAE